MKRGSFPWAILLATLALVGCERPPASPYIPPVAEVEGVHQVFAARSTPRLMAALDRFMGGRMDALHVALPPGPAMDRLAWQLRVAGVLPRKIRRDRLVAPGTVVAERYVAVVAPCPALDFSGATFDGNATRPGFGCATLADLAAQTSDPADLLGNDAAIAPDAERAALPVARWRGFASGGGGAGGGAGGGGPALPTGGGGAGAGATTTGQ
jgi:type IV pilus biogenesis protein CpaD/CtpE